MLSEATQEFTVIPVKTPVAFFTEIGKKNPKICMESKRSQAEKTIIKKERKGGVDNH